MLKNEDAFTLIEMLIVLLVISVLIILIVPNISNRSNDVHEKGCNALVTVVQAQVDLYTIEKGHKPSTLSNLVDEYISEEQLSCKNDQELKYVNGKVLPPNENE